ncbi:ribonuclease HII [Meiothermus granaticius]|uniref:Ribonuclease HII n=1 Tax=Meiothermus granaticius NBRC 107808 TaxID=1227551 RepID=A0A399FBW5_9DEIN|nr:ribonuclease HII [Meiothermus granaticius]MCL6526227.1 ribonuclease HII [Thermaceae bacterium]RIH92432.1 Ribonuclease HII [Meiothermus granaticius NBRC 107808]GEM87467.1 ribonuclease HII [Meiothermus granaticius NBRC 107808]
MAEVPEATWWAQGLRVAGVDEAGRGAWAGPVVAAAVILPGTGRYPFRDSKTLSPAQREELRLEVQAVALAWGVGFASAAEVDTVGVLRATHLAAARALEQLAPRPQALLTDYLKLSTELPLLAPAKADRDSPSVAAASILAKVARDRYMLELSLTYPQYGFAAHKGYGTPAHLQALHRFGPCDQHRRSFAPVAQVPLLNPA